MLFLSLSSCGSPEIVEEQDYSFESWRTPLYESSSKSYKEFGIEPLIIPAIASCYVEGIIKWLRLYKCPNVEWSSISKNEEIELSKCFANNYFANFAKTLSLSCIKTYQNEKEEVINE
jgi:hypothetical protein